jgi:hypothetical protein
VSLTFIAGRAADVFPAELAEAVDSGLRERFAAMLPDGEAYVSEPVEAAGWRQFQQRVLRTLDYAPQITGADGYQTVWVPAAIDSIETVAMANLADPLQVGSLPTLIEELRRFAAAASLPTDDLELMQLAAHYLESDDPNADLDIQTYVQLMLTAKQAVAHGAAVWVVV